MIGTRKISVRFKEYLVPFPVEQKQSYVLDVSNHSGNNNIFSINSSRIVEVKYSKKEQRFFIHLKTKSLKIHLGKEANRNRRVIENLASIYDDIKLQVNSEGGIIKINNIVDIIKKWKLIKQELSKAYSGSKIRIFLDRLDRKFSNEGLIKKEILQYDFFGLLLNPVFQRYNTENNRNIKREIKWLNQKISIEERLILHEINESDRMVWILIKKNSQKDEILNQYKGFYNLGIDLQCLNKAELTIGSVDNIKKYILKKID